MTGSLRLDLFDKTAEMFAEAAIDPGLWPKALAVFAEAGGAEASILMTPKTSTPLTALPPRFDELAEAATRGGWLPHNPRTRGLPPRIHRAFLCDTDVIPIDRIARDPFYNELLLPHGFNWAAGTFIHQSPTLGPVMLNLERSRQLHPFTPAELEALDTLRPSLSRSVRLAESLGFQKLEGMIVGWEHAGIAAAILDHRGRVLRTTDTLTRRLGTGLTISGRRLTAASASDQEALDEHIQGCLVPARAKAVVPVPVRRAGGRLPLILDISPLAPDRSSTLGGGRVVVMVRDPEATTPPPDQLLRSIFSLSKAEARLALALAEGGTLVDAADRLEVSHETARSQLKTVFAKTDTNRQTDLVRLISRLG